ncbi:hypothetical protein L1987_56751 [Smallanthus sonchifolius]|uniref:Uncharacterized protein n=1 Tax=Smallanthus sonchifolius TaxID=185202 RepID=A0ACB9DBC2_9ASTR|nr:hypothetical protein L1987_56751 [Smallanthus sonchifolius]
MKAMAAVWSGWQRLSGTKNFVCTWCSCRGGKWSGGLGCISSGFKSNGVILLPTFTLQIFDGHDGCAAAIYAEENRTVAFQFSLLGEIVTAAIVSKFSKPLRASVEIISKRRTHGDGIQWRQFPMTIGHLPFKEFVATTRHLVEMSFQNAIKALETFGKIAGAKY